MTIPGFPEDRPGSPIFAGAPKETKGLAGLGQNKIVPMKYHGLKQQQLYTWTLYGNILGNSMESIWDIYRLIKGNFMALEP